MANNPACCADAVGKTVRIVVPGAPVQLVTDNENRKKIMFQNRGPGNIFVHAGKETTFNVLEALIIAVGREFIDDPPWIHCGEWWVDTDAANTDVTIMEWS